MKLAIVGTGNVGSALARAFSRAGHDVVIGARDPADPAARALAARCRGGRCEGARGPQR